MSNGRQQYQNQPSLLELLAQSLVTVRDFMTLPARAIAGKHQTGKRRVTTVMPTGVGHQ